VFQFSDDICALTLLSACAVRPQPLREATDAESGRRYLLCEYNRDADSYRSPWSNKYDPPLEDAYMPRPELRKLEVYSNTVYSIIYAQSTAFNAAFQATDFASLLCYTAHSCSELAWWSATPLALVLEQA
jgi:F-actin capping protein, beta subunit